jgi:putative hydrolase of the HAD superfamily
MIRNVIFDLGNVLLGFKPEEFLIKENYPADIRQLLMKDVFLSKEWQDIDRGEITADTAIGLIAGRSLLKREEIALIFKKRDEMLIPLDLNIKLLPELKKAGYRLFFLSNFPADIFPEIRSRYSFFSYFDNGIISADVKCIKPDIRIFRIFLEKFSLDPAECLFIDDMEVNVISAREAGMEALCTYGATPLPETFSVILSVAGIDR